MNKQFVAIVVAVIVGLFGIFFFTKDSAQAPNENGSNSSSSAKGSNNTIGENAKKVTLVEFGDYQCPGCEAYQPIIEQVIEKYKKDIEFQYKHFPLQDKHPNARAAARAAEAAAKQNKFWEMHSLLFEQQGSWKDSTAVNTIFEGYAKQIGLDLEKYKTDFASSAVNDMINADVQAGKQIPIQGTPSFVFQGELLIEPPQDIDGFSKLIDQAIKDSKN